jgi:hypothetical protein
MEVFAMWELRNLLVVGSVVFAVSSSLAFAAQDAVGQAQLLLADPRICHDMPIHPNNYTMTGVSTLSAFAMLAALALGVWSRASSKLVSTPERTE